MPVADRADPLERPAVDEDGEVVLAAGLADPSRRRRSPAGSRRAAAAHRHRPARPCRRRPRRCMRSASAAPSVSASGFSWLTTSTERAAFSLAGTAAGTASSQASREKVIGRATARCRGRGRRGAWAACWCRRAGSGAGMGGSSGASPSWGRRATGVGRASAAAPPSSTLAPSSSSLMRRRIRVPRSLVSSSRTWSSGIRLIRSRTPSSWRMNGMAWASAATAALRSASVPMTLTQTFACRRSGVVSTSVIVANPIRGSETSRARSCPISCRRSSSTRSVRCVMGSRRETDSGAALGRQ